MGSEIRLSDLEMGLSSSGDATRAEMDTATSVLMSFQPSVSQPPPYHTMLSRRSAL